MSEQKPKIGKKGGARGVAKMLTEIRRKPVSKKVLQIIEESDKASKQQQDKKVAKPYGEAEI